VTEPDQPAETVRFQDAALHDPEGPCAGPGHAGEKSPSVDAILVRATRPVVFVIVLHLRNPPRSAPEWLAGRTPLRS
jgi:hypothetical protein